MTGEIERQRLQSKKRAISTLVIFRFVHDSCTPRQLGLPVRKTESSGAVFTSGRFE